MSEKPKVHPLQRAWAAGVFDARMYMPKSGCVLRFDSTDETMVRRFHQTVGVGQVAKDDTKRTVYSNWVYRTINLDDSRELLLLVSPFLSPRKMKESSDLLARIERNPTWRKRNPEKAASSVTVLAQNVADEQEQPNTATAGDTVSPVTTTGN